MSQSLRVLIVDNDRVRAENVAKIVSRAGSHAAIAPDLRAAASLWGAADVAILDDDAFGDAGLAVAADCARASPKTYRCVAARQARFASASKAAPYVFVKPFTAHAVADALAAAGKRATKARQ